MAFSQLQQIGPWAGLAAFVGGALLLAMSIRRLMRLLKASEILRVPLVERQEVACPEAGSIALCGEGPRFTRRFAGLRFALETAGGTAVPGSNSWLRATSSGFAKVRVQLLTFRIPAAGRYVLRIQGLGATQAGDAEHALLFVRPQLAATVGSVLAIIAAAWLVIGGMVLFGLSLLADSPVS